MAKSKSQNLYFEYKGHPIAVKAYFEKRNTVRFSIGRKTAIIRMPKVLPPKEQEHQYNRFKKWVSEQFDKDEPLRNRFIGKTYKDGDTLTIFNKTYNIQIKQVNRKTHAAKLKNGDQIILELSQHDTSPFTQKPIRQLLSRVIGADCLPLIEKKVDYYNDKYYQETINSIRMKLNQSNWGSCSSNRNLNFSTRLLFAPDEVIDYVIVHELAHLKEMNHSARFWKIVENVMPDYLKHERWLKENGHLCNF